MLMEFQVIINVDGEHATQDNGEKALNAARKAVVGEFKKLDSGVSGPLQLPAHVGIVCCRFFAGEDSTPGLRGDGMLP